MTQESSSSVGVPLGYFVTLAALVESCELRSALDADFVALVHAGRDAEAMKVATLEHRLESLVRVLKLSAGGA